MITLIAAARNVLNTLATGRRRLGLLHRIVAIHQMLEALIMSDGCVVGMSKFAVAAAAVVGRRDDMRLAVIPS